MRVISGSARNRKLVAPDGATTRPTPERVREATFNALGSLGAVVDADVLDLFAGSGAMGIEALSRGAQRVTFVDQDRAHRLQRGVEGLAVHFCRLNVGEPPLGRFNLHRQLVEVLPGRAGGRHQSHSANRAAAGSRLANLWVHQIGRAHV